MAFAYVFKGAKLSTSGAGDKAHYKYVSQDSTIMRVLTSKDGDILSNSDRSKESEA